MENVNKSMLLINHFFLFSFLNSLLSLVQDDGMFFDNEIWRNETILVIYAASEDLVIRDV